MNDEKQTPSNSEGAKIIYFDGHRARKAANEQIKEETCSSRIPNGRLIVECFNDGTRRTSITGDYLNNPEIAMSDAIGLASLARNLWEK
jgi:hypothetical protein